VTITIKAATAGRWNRRKHGLVCTYEDCSRTAAIICVDCYQARCAEHADKPFDYQRSGDSVNHTDFGDRQ
jgi:hypothetical protein